MASVLVRLVGQDSILGRVIDIVSVIEKTPTKSAIASPEGPEARLPIEIEQVVVGEHEPIVVGGRDVARNAARLVESVEERSEIVVLGVEGLGEIEGV